jgi:hypothetical protein
MKGMFFFSESWNIWKGVGLWISLTPHQVLEDMDGISTCFYFSRFLFIFIFVSFLFMA